MTKVLIIFKMKNLIKKILKEEFNDTDWWGEIPQITPAEEFLYDLMTNLTIVESKKWENWMVYKDKNGKFLMADEINTGTERPVLFVDYDEIWEKLMNYGLNSEETRDLCVRMLEATHKRKVLTARARLQHFGVWLETTHKRKVLTAQLLRYHLKQLLETTHKRKVLT